MSEQAPTPEGPATAPGHPPRPGAAAPTPTGPVAEPAYGATEPGSVVVDVGGNIGALVLYAPPGMAGQEIEISPRQATARRRHACVRARPGATGIGYAAVYAGLPAGEYTIWRSQQDPAATVTITGGHITTSQWQAGSAPGYAKPVPTSLNPNSPTTPTAGNRQERPGRTRQQRRR